MEKKRSLRAGELPDGATLFIARALAEVGSGRIVLSAQDSRLVSVEREERIGGEALRWQVLVYPMGALTMLSNMLLQTVRMPWRANILASARRGLFFIPMILILPAQFGLLGLEICQPVCDTLAFLLALPILLYSLRQIEHRQVA